MMFAGPAPRSSKGGLRMSSAEPGFLAGVATIVFVVVAAVATWVYVLRNRFHGRDGDRDQGEA